MTYTEEEKLAIRLMQFDARPRIVLPDQSMSTLPEFNVLMCLSIVLSSFLLSCITIWYFRKFFLNYHEETTTTAFPILTHHKTAVVNTAELKLENSVFSDGVSIKESLVKLNKYLELVSRELSELISKNMSYYTLAEKTLEVIHGKCNDLNSHATTVPLAELMKHADILSKREGNGKLKIVCTKISSDIANQLQNIKSILDKKGSSFHIYQYPSIQEAKQAVEMISDTLKKYEARKNAQLRLRITQR